MAFARVDKIDTAIESTALSNSSTVNAHQQMFNCKRAGVQRGLGCGRSRPAVVGKASRRGHHEKAGCARRIHSGGNCFEITLRYRLLFVHRCKNIVDMLPELASALGDA